MKETFRGADKPHQPNVVTNSTTTSPNTPNEIEAGSHNWWLEKFTKGLPTIITSSRTGVPELHPEFIEALTQLNASRTAEMEAIVREMMDKSEIYNEGSQVGVERAVSIETIRTIAQAHGITIN